MDTDFSQVSRSASKIIRKKSFLIRGSTQKAWKRRKQVCGREAQCCEGVTFRKTECCPIRCSCVPPLECEELGACLMPQPCSRCNVFRGGMMILTNNGAIWDCACFAEVLSMWQICIWARCEIIGSDNFLDCSSVGVLLCICRSPPPSPLWQCWHCHHRCCCCLHCLCQFCYLLYPWQEMWCLLIGPRIVGV